MSEHVCKRCGWIFHRKSNLTQHLTSRKNPCGSSSGKNPLDWVTPSHHHVVVKSLLGQKRNREEEIPTFDGSQFGTGKPKSKETMDKLERFVKGEPAAAAEPSPKARAVLNRLINNEEGEAKTTKKFIPPAIVAAVIPGPPPAEVVSEVFPVAVEADTPPEAVVPRVFPRTKEEVTGWCSDDYTDDDNEEEEDDDDGEPNLNVQFLPATVDGLYKRFKKLFCEFMRNGKHENRNEIVFLLDELLRQNGIPREAYTQVNNLLAESLGSGSEEEEEKDDAEMEVQEPTDGDVKTLSASTTEHIIQDDKVELMDLLKKFKEEAGGEEDYIDTVNELEELIEIFLTDEFLDGNPIITQINDLRRKLEDSPISKAKQQRLKMLLNDIKNNRYRVYSILTRLHDAEDMSNVLPQLVQEELLSLEQYEKLAELKEIDLPTVANIIKQTKMVQGLRFLPRALGGLKKKLELLIGELAADTGRARVKNELAAVLEELLRRNGISHKQYTSIKQDNDIL